MNFVFVPWHYIRARICGTTLEQHHGPRVKVRVRVRARVYFSLTQDLVK